MLHFETLGSGGPKWRIRESAFKNLVTTIRTYEYGLEPPLLLVRLARQESGEMAVIDAGVS